MLSAISAKKMCAEDYVSARLLGHSTGLFLLTFPGLRQGVETLDHLFQLRFQGFKIRLLIVEPL